MQCSRCIRQEESLEELNSNRSFIQSEKQSIIFVAIYTEAKDYTVTIIVVVLLEKALAKTRQHKKLRPAAPSK